MVPTPGHTPGHVSVVVQDGAEQIMLAGDASYLELAMLRGTVDGVSPDETEVRGTLAAIRNLCSQRPTVYLPTHDPQSAERLGRRRPSGLAADVSGVTTALRRGNAA